LKALRADWNSAAELFHPDIRLDQSRMPDGGVYFGQLAFANFYRGWFGTWDELRLTPERFIDAGERVIFLLTVEGRGKGAGTPVSLFAVDIWTVRDGQVTELVAYPDRREGLEAAGLSE
jgi:ketosteroid isomerase-like protein